MVPLTHHIRERQRLSPEVAGDVSAMMTQIALGGKRIARDLCRSGLTDMIGTTGETNVQGEQVQKLDELANRTFVEVFEQSEIVRVVISEEMAEPFLVPRAARSGSYAVFVDPLDGSSNVDVNAPLGSIFSIHRVDASGHFLKKGADQLAGGYLLYGPGTLLVYTCGDGVHQFTLDPSANEFFLSMANIRVPDCGAVYSVNEGNRSKWSADVRSVIDSFQEVNPSTGRACTARYTGCLVADVHRILLKGGLYLYPGEVNKPEGKLRLMYEAAPLSFVVEQAGGIGSTGTERIASIQPKDPHQRVPLMIGSRDDVERVEQALSEQCRQLDR